MLPCVAPDEKPERILLLRREVTLAIEHEESYSLLFNDIDGSPSTISLDVDCDIQNVKLSQLRRDYDCQHRRYLPKGMSFSILRGHPHHEQRLTLYPKDEDRMLFSFSFNPSDISMAAWTDIRWAQKVRLESKRKSSPLKEFQLHSSLTLTCDDEGRWSCSLMMKVTVDAINKWSNRSLELSRNSYWELFAHGLPVGQPDILNFAETRVTPRDFYLSVHVPEKAEQVPLCIQHRDLTCELLPFQRRAINWMLKREGVQAAPAAPGNLAPFKARLGSEIPPTFFKQLDKNGDTCYVSHILGVASKDLDKVRELTIKDDINGGILAEEMGLGKTVEIIALLCLHRRQCVPGQTVWDECVERDVKASPGTLIITPPSILHQWQNEIATHAPELKGIS
jgi:hypothetical protein